MRIHFDDLQTAIAAVLNAHGFITPRAHLCARLFAETDLDGVYTHGVARLPRFLAQIKNKVVDPQAIPTLTASFGAIERWQGNHGPGNLNAYASMARAVTLARQHGIGCVALAGTNHWMRGGTYGWQAAASGCFAMCFTNTLPNLPAWGTAQPILGNNPLVLAVPRATGAHIILDMATSQFSYGTLSAYIAQGKQLPYPGGFDAQGNLTTDPATIEQSGRSLPIGLWKGSGLSLTLDLIASMLSAGQPTHEKSRDPLHETNLSQLFLAIDPTRITQDPNQLEQTAIAVLANLHAAQPLTPGHPPRYPGEQTLRTRTENLAQGIPVDDHLWHQLRTNTL